MTDHDDLRFLLGGYVLGGLGADDRHRLEQHLATCAECRAELARLAPLPGLLRRADESPATARPGDDLLPRLLDAVTRERVVRRRRRAVVSGMVAAAVAVAVLAGWSLWDRDPSDAPVPPAATVVALTVVDDDTTARGQAELLEKAWGTAVTLSAEQLPDEGPFTLQVTSADGTRQLAATWGPTPAGGALVAGATSIPAEEIASVQVLGPGGPLLAGAPAAETG